MGIYDNYKKSYDMLSSYTNQSSQKINQSFPQKINEEEMVCYPEDDTFGLSSATPEKTESKLTIDDKKLEDMMRISAKKGSEKVSEKIAEITKAIPFAESDANGNVNADLSIGVVDYNGFMDYGNQDLNVTLNGNIKVKKDVFYNSLKSLEGKAVKRSTKADVDIGKVRFDSKDKSYKIQLKIDGLLFLNDTVDLVVKSDKNNNLQMSVDGKWLPDWLASDDEILSEARSAIAKELKKANFGLDTKIVDEKLYFLPKIEKQEIKLNSKESLRIDRSNIDFHNTGFSIDKYGDISVKLKNVSITASNIGYDDKHLPLPAKSGGDIDFAFVKLSADINTKGDKEINIKEGRVFTQFDKKESQIVKIEGSSLGDHFEDIKADVQNIKGNIKVSKDNKVNSNIGADVSLSLNRPNKSIGIDGNLAASFNSNGDFKVASKGLSVSHPNGVSEVNQLYIASDKNGFEMDLDIKEKELAPIKTKASDNHLKLLVGPDKYKEALFKRLEQAKESINVESYLYSGDIGTSLTDKLLEKASGLSASKDGNFQLSDKNGVKVKVIFDSSKGDKTPETHGSMILVNKRHEEFLKDLKTGKGKFSGLSAEQKQTALDNLNKNMKWNMLEGGITKIDHRKLVIIDGKSAFTGGGINFTDSAFRKHDMMVDVWGPAVKDIQREFIENWEEVAGKIPEADKKSLIKDEKSLTRSMKEQQRQTKDYDTSKTQLLVTDDHQFDVYQKAIEQIRNAKSINIEHAYFTDAKIVDEVAGALKRGAKVNVIVPEYSDEGDTIHYGNLASLQKLKNASMEPGAGEFNAFLYKWDHINNTGQFSHTKAMSFDDNTAIIGSANMTTRSLRGTVSDFLFNKEMALFVEDKSFVKELNKDLFKRDMTPEFAIKLDDKWFEDLKKEQKKIDKFAALQPLF